MATALGRIDIRLAGESTASATALRACAPHVVVLTTALADVPMTLISTYVGAHDVETTVVDVALGRRPAAGRSVRTVPRDALPVTHARERCLLDHLAQVRDALEQATGVAVTIDVPNDALGAAR